MEILFAIAALALPVLLGGLWLNLLVPPGTVARGALVWGYGSLLGLLLIPLLIRGLDAVTVPLSFEATALSAGALMVLAIVGGQFKSKPSSTAPAVPHTYSSAPHIHKVLCIFLLSLIVIRVVTLGMEVWFRPLFPWDATMHWATKARVWFEFRTIVPFVDNSVWLNLGGEGVFTDRHPFYPQTIPLLQVWMNLAIGHWDESLMNLPWLLCFTGLGIAFYGQLRASKLSPVMAMTFTYLLLSLPLLNIHVALAGYADLFLGAAYCAAIMALHSWVSTKQRWQAILALLFVIACPLIKNEGMVWSLTFIPALVLMLTTRRSAVKLGALISLLIIFLAILVHKNPVVVSDAMGQLTSFNSEGLVGTVKSVFLHDNWHLLGFLLLALVPLGMFLPDINIKAYSEVIVTLTGAVALFLFLFLYTVFGEGASNFTGVGRLCIQLAPGLMFLCALMCNDLVNQGAKNPAPDEDPVIA
jgi:hypothetical protein